MNTNGNKEVYLLISNDKFDGTNLVKSMHDLSENEMIAYKKEDIFKFLNNYIRNVLYNCGFEEYIQKATSFDSKKYKRLQMEYFDLFNNNRYNLNGVKSRAFNYINSVLSNTNVYSGYINEEFIEINEKLDNDIYMSISKITKDVKLNKYGYLRDYVDFLGMQQDVSIKKIKIKRM